MKKKCVFIVSILLLISLLFLCFLTFGKKKVYFNLLGNNTLKLDYEKKYNEFGYEAKLCNKYFKIFCSDITNSVKLKRKPINHSSYIIDYTLYYDNYKKVLSRLIKFTDNTSPVISLMDTTNNRCPNKEYIEEGYSAYDNIDGNITEKVVTSIKDNKVYYTVEDSSGNKKVVYRDIKYNDKETPIISLNGGNVVYLFLNSNYSEYGYSATDNCDGDITSNVVVSNNVNSSKEGEYDVNYSIIDSSGNKNSIVRKVIVYKDESIVPKNGKKVYLTFDDGPCSYTEEILNVLKKYNVKATFFVTNQFSSYNDMIKKEYENGHTIGIHTYSHNYKEIYNSLDNYLNDFNNMNKIIFEQTGIYSKIFRFPGGSSNTISKSTKGIITDIANKLTEDGYIYFDWNIDSGDTTSKDPNTIYENVINEIQKKDVSIVLMHDIKKANIESVDKIISYGLQNGYTFLPIDMNTTVIHHHINN